MEYSTFEYFLMGLFLLGMIMPLAYIPFLVMEYKEIKARHRKRK